MLLMLGSDVRAQVYDIPSEYRGTVTRVARGVMDGNLIETNYRNHGELSRWDDVPQGVYPRGTNNRHIDGVGLLVAGRVVGERAKWPQFYPNANDTLLTPVILNYRDFGRKIGDTDGLLWGWLPLSGFHNPIRRNPITGRNEPTPAPSDDPTTWPEFWPDRLTNPDDPGWAGQWNGLFGRGVFNADLESYYVVDDHQDYEYRIDPRLGLPNSPYGIYYPSPSDSTIGGLGLRTGVRLLQWANVLAEDVMFMLYEVYNNGETYHDSLYFAQIVDYGFSPETEGIAAFDPQLDIAFGWDARGDAIDQTGRQFPVAHVGFAFLESPARRDDGVDNDEDGVIDEDRFSGPGIRIEGQDAIRAYVEANYDTENFRRAFANNPDTDTFEDVLTSRPAYEVGIWWTGDENMNWRTFGDENENGRYDAGEAIFNDTGRDGLGPNDLGYPGPDDGEADGIPTAGEANFDRLDIPESDQIGLTGFDLSTRPFYENGDNLRDDTWLWGQMQRSLFPLGTKPAQFIADVEPFLLFESGAVKLDPQQTDFFSLAWVFGLGVTNGGAADNASAREDFFKNRITVQNIYDANYNFAQPPFIPTLTAVPGDREVLLGWDDIALQSFDRFTQTYDFEGFKLYRGTDPLLLGTRSITDVNGTPTFNRPIAQFDLKDGIRGNVPVLGNTAIYDLGSDTGLQFFYVDRDVTNGIRYYYALVAYDQGVYDEDGNLIIDPQENVFNFAVDEFSNLRQKSQNAAAVVPRSRAAGFVNSGTDQDLSRPTEGSGTGGIDVRIVIQEETQFGDIYQITFRDSTLSTTDYFTDAYMVENVTQGTVIVPWTEMATSTPLIDGFFVEIFNDELIEPYREETGWVVNDGTAEEQTSLDPRDLDGVNNTWIGQVAIRESSDLEPNWEYIPANFELRFFDEDVYYPPRFQTTRYLRDSLNVMGYNLETGEETELLVLDLNDNGQYDSGDELIIDERIGTRFFRAAVRFRTAAGEEVRPGAGDVFRIANRKPFRDGDYFRFELSSPTVDSDLAAQEMENIHVVPNPYVATSALELRSSTQARGDRLIQFVNLPQQCTIRIYNLRGEMVSSISHEGVGNDGTAYWDLRSSDNQDVAYGVYLYHVEAPGIGEKVGKFALIK